jgi:hypothetical protein
MRLLTVEELKSVAGGWTSDGCGKGGGSAKHSRSNKHSSRKHSSRKGSSRRCN